MRCVSVELIEVDSDLYDLEIDGGTNNYIANGVVVHNTFAAFCFWPGLNHAELLDGNWFAYSKGLGAQGLVFKDNDANANNLYQRHLKNSAFVQLLTEMSKNAEKQGFAQEPITILGEIFGSGVQDLAYGQSKPSFRMFDVYSGAPGNGRWLDWEELKLFSDAAKIPLVPVLYEGPYNEEKLVAVRDGKDTISNSNVREGIVVKSQVNRIVDELGRVMLKMVSPDYLLRKGNVTEYQ